MKFVSWKILLVCTHHVFLRTNFSVWLVVSCCCTCWSDRSLRISKFPSFFLFLLYWCLFNMIVLIIEKLSWAQREIQRMELTFKKRAALHASAYTRGVCWQSLVPIDHASEGRGMYFVLPRMSGGDASLHFWQNIGRTVVAFNVIELWMCSGGDDAQNRRFFECARATDLLSAHECSNSYV